MLLEMVLRAVGLGVCVVSSSIVTDWAVIPSKDRANDLAILSKNVVTVKLRLNAEGRDNILVSCFSRKWISLTCCSYRICILSP